MFGFEQGLMREYPSNEMLPFYLSSMKYLNLPIVAETTIVLTPMMLDVVTITITCKKPHAPVYKRFSCNLCLRVQIE